MESESSISLGGAKCECKEQRNNVEIIQNNSLSTEKGVGGGIGILV